MKGAEMLAQILGTGAVCTYLVCATSWTVLGIVVAINVTTGVVAHLVKS